MAISTNLFRQEEMHVKRPKGARDFEGQTKVVASFKVTVLKPIMIVTAVTGHKA